MGKYEERERSWPLASNPWYMDANKLAENSLYRSPLVEAMCSFHAQEDTLSDRFITISSNPHPPRERISMKK